MHTRKKRFSTERMVKTAVLAALVAILQLTSTYLLKLGITNICLVLIPIVLGAIMMGPSVGAFLGFEFGMVVYLSGIFGLDAFTNILFQAHPIATGVICIVKGTAAGFVAGIVYRLLEKHRFAAVFAAAATAPVVNTGLFVLGSLIVKDTVQAMAMAESVSFVYFVFILCAGVNFIFELLLNVLLSPTLLRIVEAVKKQSRHGRHERP